MKTTHRNVPFIIAAILFVVIVATAYASGIRPSTVSHGWWGELSNRDQAMFILGYQASSYAWTHGLVEANKLEPLNGPTAHIYTMLAPVVSYGYDELQTAITNYYRMGNPDRPVWEVITNYATEFKEHGGGT